MNFNKTKVFVNSDKIWELLLSIIRLFKSSKNIIKQNFLSQGNYILSYNILSIFPWNRLIDFTFWSAYKKKVFAKHIDWTT